MAIETKLQTRFVVQKLFAVVLCLVLGLWGVYDYAVKIPKQARLSERGRIFTLVKTALEAEPESSDRVPKIEAAQTAVRAEQANLLDLETTQTPSREEILEAIQSIEERNDQQWLKVLAVFETALREAQDRKATDPASKTISVAYTAAQEGLNVTGQITPPGAYDRAIQWMFILCLPFVPYFLWSLLRAKKGGYRLDDDGTLTAPGVSWSRSDIADIDMDRWMAKSVATVAHSDGRRQKLDDYVYKNTHLIVGALASEQYPERWDSEAKRCDTEEAATAETPADEVAATPDDAGT